MSIFYLLKNYYEVYSPQMVPIKPTGSWPIIYGRSVSTNSFNKKVGIGSGGHDLIGDCMISLRTSAALHGENTDNDSAVAARTVFTLSSK